MAPQSKPIAGGKKAKLFNSRTIRTEIVDPSFKNGGINIPEFIASREYEIKAFEQSQLNTKASSATRVFQSLPRTLRRRTASHNVKRIPKRLRAKAMREMQTATGTPVKKAHLRGRVLYRLKMQKKLLRLASKIKEIRGTPQTQASAVREKIQCLNKQLAELQDKKTGTINNAVGAFDRCSVGSLAAKPTGGIKYGDRQKEFTWMPTHVWHAKRFHMTKRWGFQIPYSPNQKCFRSTSRAAKQTAIAFESSHYCELIVECQNEEGASSFLRSYTRYCDSLPRWLIKGEKVYNGWLYLQEQKWAPGVVLVDSASCKVLVRLHPSVYETFFNSALEWSNGKYDVVDCRFALGSVELRGPQSLNSLSQILHLEADNSVKETWRAYSQSKDPGLIPQGTFFSFNVKDPRFWKKPVKAPPVDMQLNQAVLSTDISKSPCVLGDLLDSGARTKSYRDMFSIKQIGKEFSLRDSESTHIHSGSVFPVIILKTSQESWCVLMPWFWVQPLWSKLISVKGVKPAGLRQAHQLNFENNIATFPHDFPFTSEGYKEHLMEVAAAKVAKEKLPRSKQMPTTEIENPLTDNADWYFLWKWMYGMRFVDNKTEKGQMFGVFDAQKGRVLRTPEDLAIAINATRESNSGRAPLAAYNKNNEDHRRFLDGSLKLSINDFPPLPVVSVSLSISETGTAKDNARIYERVNSPTLHNLIGFVSSGAFNFNIGHPTAIGLISASHKSIDKVLIRNVGCTKFHKATLKLM